MCFYARNATASHRRSFRRRQAPTLPPLATLDLSKPGERQAHGFLVRASSGRDRMWELLAVRRLATVLLCVVRWLHADNAKNAFALAEVSLTETAVRWQHYSRTDAAQVEMERRSAAFTESEVTD